MLVLFAATVLSIAVAGGLLLAVLNARHRQVPAAAGFAHAGTAVAGVVLLTVGITLEDTGLAVNAALFLFAIALVGGVFVLLFRLQPERPPMFMIALHGATAIAGLAVLWGGVLATG
ncbi:MAG: hypothetical protein U5K33_09450 [Halofilum sp. (in: g-proteobacteria)]|nr:hypothetical protein [Halofilum sp. (in: g-proteobacteria)]